MTSELRRQSDKPSWQKVAHNIVLVGSVFTALLVGVRLVGRYYIFETKLKIIERIIEANTRNLSLVSQRVGRTERELDKREERIADNEEEIERLRNERKR